MGFLDWALPGANLVAGIWDSIQNRKVSKDNAQLEYESNKYAVDETNRANMELAKYQNEYNTTMWHKQNEYNSPVNQAKLFEEAGFNKQAILGNINSSASSPAPAASYEPDYSRYQAHEAAVAPISVSDALTRAFTAYAQLQDVQMKEEDLKQKRLDTRLKTQSFDWNLSLNKTRAYLADQKWKINGGIYSDNDANFFRNFQFRDRKNKISLGRYQSDWYKALGKTELGYKQPLYNSIINMNKTKLHEYDTVYRPFFDTFGAWSPFVSSTAKSGVDFLFDVIGKLIPSPKGIKSIGDLIKSNKSKSK